MGLWYTLPMQPITIETIVNESVEKVWTFYTDPVHITKWNHASDDWHSPRATNDLRVGGTFSSRMEAKDGSMGFDFAGTYDEVEVHKVIAYHMLDRKVRVVFTEMGNSTHVVVTFDPETQNPIEMQKGGWQSILDNFRKYTETH